MKYQEICFSLYSFLIMNILCPVVNGQNLEVSYIESLKFNINGHEDDPEMQQLRKDAIRTKTLTYSEGKSIYYEHSTSTGNNGEMRYILSGELTVNVYKSQDEKEIIKELDLYSRHFIIRTDGHVYQWKIEPEQKKIGEYLCQKATCILDTLPVTVWYSNQIPVSDGPDVFWGLPGLILEVQIGDGAKTILASKVEYKEKGTLILPPSNGKVVSEEEYVVIKAKKLKEMRAGSGKLQHSQSLKVD
jgi:GLPGLI family protein